MIQGQMRNSDKVIVLVSVLLFLACAVVMLRFYSLHLKATPRRADDWLIVGASIVWTVVEINVGIFAACLPILRPVVACAKDFTNSRRNLLPSFRNRRVGTSEEANNANSPVDRTHNNPRYGGHTYADMADTKRLYVCSFVTLPNGKTPHLYFGLTKAIIGKGCARLILLPASRQRSVGIQPLPKSVQVLVCK